MKLGILQARMSSSRLPGKVLRPILGGPMIARHIERLQRTTELDDIIVATSVEKSDDAIEETCKDIGVKCYRGSLDNVLNRYYETATYYGADQIIRLTADCPLADWQVIDQIMKKHVESGADYTSNTLERSHPDGLDAEAMTYALLKRSNDNASTKEEKEHVTPYAKSLAGEIKIEQVVQSIDMSCLRWTVDNPEDFELVRLVYEALYPQNKAFTTEDILNFLLDNPDVRNLNIDDTAAAKYDELAKLRLNKAS